MNKKGERMFKSKQLTIRLTMTIFLSLISLQLYSATEKPKLRDYKYSIYSQWGEDGIIQKIFEIIGTRSKVCIEFGAWDGIKYANTAALWKNKNWKAILIEADTSKFSELLNNVRSYNCIAINRYVGIGPDNSLEAILQQNNIHDQIDLLSIDIDGDDYHIFESLRALHPRVIICEYNPTIPAELDIYQQYGDYFGCSVGALVRVAATKGYTLVAITETNVFFVENSLINLFYNYELTLSKIAVNDYVKYIIFSYAGMPVIIGKKPGFAFEIHNLGYPKQLNHKHEILRIKQLSVAWPPEAGSRDPLY